MSKSRTKKYEEFEPNILVFCCNWCSYAGADLAGVSRFQYPSTIRIVRVMCSGRVEPAFILRAFYNGIDGVIVTGCHIGDCHYIKGNEHAYIRLEHLQNLLKKIGIEEERFLIHPISASEGKKFSELIKEFTEKVKKEGILKIAKKLGLLEFQYS
ncbi:MAG: hydrogenase iron-sulfur subunit [Candidatus Hodarchaeota archaeon]